MNRLKLLLGKFVSGYIRQISKLGYIRQYVISFRNMSRCAINQIFNDKINS